MEDHCKHRYLLATEGECRICDSSIDQWLMRGLRQYRLFRSTEISPRMRFGRRLSSHEVHATFPRRLRLRSQLAEPEHRRTSLGRLGRSRIYHAGSIRERRSISSDCCECGEDVQREVSHSCLGDVLVEENVVGVRVDPEVQADDWGRSGLREYVPHESVSSLLSGTQSYR